MTDTTTKLLYRAGTCAKKCEITKRTWSRWVKKGKAPQPIIIGTNTRRWPAAELDEWVKRLIKEM